MEDEKKRNWDDGGEGIGITREFHDAIQEIRKLKLKPFENDIFPDGGYPCIYTDIHTMAGCLSDIFFQDISVLGIFLLMRHKNNYYLIYPSYPLLSF